MCANFSDRETAELWGKYKEDLIDEMHFFQPPEDQLVTIKEAFNMKYDDLQKKGKDKRTISDLITCQNHLKAYWNQPISFFTYDFFMILLQDWETSLVGRGGDMTGKTERFNLKPPSPHTLIRRFAVISTVFAFLIEKGINITNNAQKVTSYIRQRTKEKKC